MNKQKGISQIAVMIIMLVLAIALPLTTNLVKKSQENRSKAAASTCGDHANGSSWCGGRSGMTIVTCDNGTITNGETCLNGCSIGTCLKSPDPNPPSSVCGGRAEGSFWCENSNYMKCSGGKSEVEKTGGCNDTCASSRGGTCGTVASCQGKGTIVKGLCPNYWGDNSCCVPNNTAASGAFSGSSASGSVGTAAGGAGAAAGGAGAAVSGGAFSGSSVSGGTNCGSHASGSSWCGGRSGMTIVTCSNGTETNGQTCLNGCSNGSCAAPAPVTCGSHANGSSWCGGRSGMTIVTCDNGTETNGQTCLNGCSIGTCLTAPAPAACVPNCNCADSIYTDETCSNSCNTGNCTGKKTFTNDNACAVRPGGDCGNFGQSAGASCKNGTGKVETGLCGSKLSLQSSYQCCVSNPVVVVPTCTFTYSGWSDCNPNGTKTRTVVTSSPSGCVGGSQDLSDPCQYTPPAPDYVAPKLNMYVSIMGVRNGGAQCLGNIVLKVNVNEAGEAGQNFENITATKVDSKFSMIKVANDGYQVYEIKNLQLRNTFALNDKIYINITSQSGNHLRLLSTLYGKDGQNKGFPGQDTSEILVSSLTDGKILNLADYPILNGDIGSQGDINKTDGQIDSFDFAWLVNEWGETNSVADLNGDCLVNSFDFVIYKNSATIQMASKSNF